MNSRAFVIHGSQGMLGTAGYVNARQSRFGEAWRGQARPVMARQSRSVWASRGAACLCLSRQSRRGNARCILSGLVKEGDKRRGAFALLLP